MATPELIQVMELSLPLESEEEIERVKMLVRKKPGNYLVDSFSPDGEKSPTLLLHSLVYLDEGETIVSRIRGSGAEPDSSCDERRRRDLIVFHPEEANEQKFLSERVFGRAGSAHISPPDDVVALTTHCNELVVVDLTASARVLVDEQCRRETSA